MKYEILNISNMNVEIVLPVKGTFILTRKNNKAEIEEKDYEVLINKYAYMIGKYIDVKEINQSTTRKKKSKVTVEVVEEDTTTEE